MQHINLERCKLIRGSLLPEAERKRKLYNEYEREEDAYNFVNTLQKAKILLGIINVRMKKCAVKTREETRITVSIGQQPSRIKLP